jgi:predicted nucleotidyltransferase
MCPIVTAEMDFRRPLSVVAPTLDGDVLGVLAGAHEEFTGRRIHQVLGRGSEAGVRKAADRLVEQGIVTRRQAGQAKLYSLNRNHLAAAYIEGLGSLRSKLIKKLKATVGRWETPPAYMALFGSVARGEAGPQSDLDLFVLRPPGTLASNSVWQEQLAKLENDATVWTGNEARIVQFRVAELKDLEVRKIVREVSREGVPIYGDPSELRLAPRKVKRRA